ncbi:hypothetical protein LOK49_LG11G00457 [Camellia lanceoleosa]|uniref:Uncharacterized protein n=1 Tax=Camellia lanceoleosa TaxID=1840588 RepID=A0ACC0FWJ7_9ERIC|nr:hypothetical protein LOK49_LG11G00457 [Camellia lanceoleosa]
MCCCKCICSSSVFLLVLLLHNSRQIIFPSTSKVGCNSFYICDWSFMGGSRIIIRPNLQRFNLYRKPSGVFASWLASPQIASSVFTLGTAAVLPFYTLMVVAPKAELTKKSMESSIPYVLLGLLYAYLLYLSWTPDTIKLMFASKYWLPEVCILIPDLIYSSAAWYSKDVLQ